ncbi:ATP-dependent helicase HrpB [Thermus thermamylovorans]|uniref:ATP-dependent helicase HrpB n=1 Tax=Thermus thermamylovorans TaxID=2509362 RepID=A0A4Q9B556_9DEIN|nr:ATP-dependent helicase HrpB [Thermus thermamylovorans]TBH21110.1 ATP-dependent helicase HrpB [Thermus thermamylovorans]
MAGWLDQGVALLRKEGRLLLVAPPGAGKSTLFPLKVLQALPGQVFLFAPRRVAARAVAARLAENLGEPLGKTVGYRVRLEGRESGATRLLVMTEGLLTRRLLEDPTLEGVSAVLLDEAHERHLETDLSLALLLRVQETLRHDLKIALLTATPDEDLRRAFSGAVLEVAGEAHPVAVFHLPKPPEGPLEPLAARYAKKAFLEGEGDVLVFLPGKAEIERTKRLLEDLPAFPLHGGLPLAEQAALLRPGPRRIVLATDVAETSLTLPGVRAVVDTGLAKKPRFDPRTGLTRLARVRIPEASARQRAGRAGRTGPGRVYRLYPEGPFPPQRPEVLEADLSRALLLALGFGERLEALPLPTPPPQGALEAAWDLLGLLGAVAGEGLTPLGRRMLLLPTHPRLARMVLEAEALGLLPLAADLLALLEERDPLEGEPDLLEKLSGLLEARRAGRGAFLGVERVAALWRGRLGVKPLERLPAPEAVGRLLLAAYPDRAAERVAPGRYRLATGPLLRLPGEGPAYLVAVGAEAGPKEGRLLLFAPLAREDLLKRAEVAAWTGWEEGRLRGYLERRHGSLVLERVAVDPGPPTEAHLREALKEGLPLPEEARQVLLRLAFLKAHGVAVPELSEEALLEDLSWLLPWTEGVRQKEELRGLPWKEILLGLLGEARKTLEALAPEALALPSGKRRRLEYRPDAPPLLALRVQEAFGLWETPRVLGGKVPVAVALLSPAGRPVQVTQDLEGFWERHYPKVRQELMRRYPKHPWPERP